MGDKAETLSQQLEVSETPNIDWLRDHIRRLSLLLDKPERGLMTWHHMYGSLMDELTEFCVGKRKIDSGFRHLVKCMRNAQKLSKCEVTGLSGGEMSKKSKDLERRVDEALRQDE